MRMSVSAALIALVAATFALTGGVVDGVWWWIARSDALRLADTLNGQTVEQVRADVAALIDGAEAAYDAIAAPLAHNVIDVSEEDKREILFLAQVKGRAALSRVAFAQDGGAFFAVHKAADGSVDAIDTPAGPLPKRERIDSYRTVGTTAVQRQAFEATSFDATAQPWVKGATGTPSWSVVRHHPDGEQPSVAYVGRVVTGSANSGVLAVMMDVSRLSDFLAGLKVGKTGAAFILNGRGDLVAAPTAAGAERSDPGYAALLGAARTMHDHMAAVDPASDEHVRGNRVTMGRRTYAVTVTSLRFMDWEVATIIPDADFLGAVDQTNLRVSALVLLLVLGAVLMATQFARRMIVDPLARVAGQLAKVRRFDLDGIRHAPARLYELDLLSRVIADMAAGLSAFRRYIPADLVGTLVSEGIEARPGGTVQPVTVLFADIEGFTGMSEAMGEAAFALLTRYFEIVTAAVTASGGTVDKFMGDGVMAFWGAPNPDPDQARAACEAALACLSGLRSAGLTDHEGRPLAVRIGINSGDALVGNIGTAERLNYTVIGDAVNMASRMECANKAYGTSVIIGEATRRAVHGLFATRWLDRTVLRGRSEPTDIHELVGACAPSRASPDWINLHEAGLALKTSGRWTQAAALFSRVIAVRGEDAPSRTLLGRGRDVGAPEPASAAVATGAGRPARTSVARFPSAGGCRARRCPSRTGGV